MISCFSFLLLKIVHRPHQFFVHYALSAGQVFPPSRIPTVCVPLIEWHFFPKGRGLANFVLPTMEDAKNDVPQIILGRLVIGVRTPDLLLLCRLMSRIYKAAACTQRFLFPFSFSPALPLKTPQDASRQVSDHVSVRNIPSLLEGQSPDTLPRTDHWKKTNRVASPASDLVDGVNACIQVNQAIVSLEYSYCRCALFFPD